jgi:hypothetical protein
VLAENAEAENAEKRKKSDRKCDGDDNPNEQVRDLVGEG